jgi:hypothetical protein
MWAADVLGMSVNTSNAGPDLLSSSKIVELKFFIRNPKPHPHVKSNRYPAAWTVDEGQMKYPEDAGKKGYWGLGSYELTKAIRSIPSNSIDLERFVVPESRELFIVEWSWMDQFQKSYTSGSTDNTSWESYLRYPKFNRRPETQITYEVEGGVVHLTEGVDLDDFRLEDLEPVLNDEDDFF